MAGLKIETAGDMLTAAIDDVTAATANSAVPAFAAGCACVETGGAPPPPPCAKAVDVGGGGSGGGVSVGGVAAAAPSFKGSFAFILE